MWKEWIEKENACEPAGMGVMEFGEDFPKQLPSRILRLRIVKVFMERAPVSSCIIEKLEINVKANTNHRNGNERRTLH